MEQSEQRKYIGSAHRASDYVELESADVETSRVEGAALARVVNPDATLKEAADILKSSTLDSLPLLDPHTGEAIGFLVKPGGATSAPSVSAPRLGGMATPLGVYLHDGVSGGGAGFLGLMLSGALLAFLGIIAQLVSVYVTQSMDSTVMAAAARSPQLASIIGSGGADQLIFGVFSVSLLLSMVRLLPLAGTHAAEHQVVHCVEQGAPLTIQCVRSMPRVHPRCGTNLLTGLVLFVSVFVAVDDFAIVKHIDTWDAATLGVIIAAPLALTYWRRIGAFMQYWLATKPATDAQIAGAIRAAEQVFDKRARQGDRIIKFRLLRRIWAMGLPQVLLGYAAVYLLVRLLCAHWPWLGATLEM